MHDLLQTLINEEFTAESVSPEELDAYLANGWRHFGTHFFRYNLAFYDDDIRRVIPLRIRLSEFKLSQSQQRVLRRNQDLVVSVDPVSITTEVEALFDRHKSRFERHQPDNIYTFIADDPKSEPCNTVQQSIRLGGRLLAAGFFDIGGCSVSGIYTSFEPAEKRRSLGIFTILKEIEYAIANGMEFYYQGYCYSGESFYDYKKRFRGTETFDWHGNWVPLID
jgi:leucyl-tRNA---protein transferase